MSIRSSKSTLTLVFYVVLVLALSICSEAKSVHLHHRDHANLKRLIKKRSPQGLGPVIGAAAPPPIFTSTSTATVTSISSPSPVTQSTSSASTSTSEIGTSSLNSDSSSLTTTTSSSSTSQTSTSTSASSTVSTPSNSPTSEPLTVTSAPSIVSAQASKSTITQTESVDPTSTSSTTASPQSGASTTNSTTLMVVIVIGSCIVGVAILWTVFRKWKLGRSSKFDERLQPIDWHPTSGADGSQRRLSTASSFHSGGHGGSDHGHPSSVLEHDFTAGPATLTPVGGYADLARGSSPQPQMHQVARGPSMTRPAYDVGVPLHHQAGYSAQDAYDGSRY